MIFNYFVLRLDMIKVVTPLTYKKYSTEGLKSVQVVKLYYKCPFCQKTAQSGNNILRCSSCEVEWKPNNFYIIFEG